MCAQSVHITYESCSSSNKTLHCATHAAASTSPLLLQETSRGVDAARSAATKSAAAGGTSLELQAQPSFLTAGQLRDYQLEGLNWMTYAWLKVCVRGGEMGDVVGVWCMCLFLAKAVRTASSCLPPTSTRVYEQPRYIPLLPLFTPTQGRNAILADEMVSKGGGVLSFSPHTHVHACTCSNACTCTSACTCA